ncbi:MAG: glycosyltransferase [bacterium]
MHLAIVSLLPPVVSGIADYGKYLSEAFSELSKFEQISIITQVEAEPDILDNKLPHVRVFRVWNNNLMGGWHVINTLHKLNPDVVWFNLAASMFGISRSANIIGALILLFGGILKTRSVVTLHEVLPAIDNNLVKKKNSILLPFITKKICKAKVICLLLNHHVMLLRAICNEANLVCIPHGIYLKPEKIAEPAKQAILFFGTISPYKGIEFLITSFREVIEKNPELSLIIAGGEHPRFHGYLKHLKNVYSNTSGIVWKGYVPDCELISLFSSSTLTVFPYIYSTGASGAIFWASTFGRPLVVSDIPELRASCDEIGLMANYFKVNDIQGLTLSINNLLADSDLREKQVQNNISVINNYTLQKTADSYANIFSGIMN